MRLRYTSGTRKFAVALKPLEVVTPASQSHLIRHKSKGKKLNMQSLFVFARTALGPKFVLLNLQRKLTFTVADDASSGH